MPGTGDREWWERARDRWLTWLTGRPVRARIVLVVAAASVLVVVLAGVLIGGFGRGLRVWLPCAGMLLGWLLITPTKTVRWPSVLRLFSAAAVWAVGIGVLTTSLTGRLGLPVSAAGPTIGIAAVARSR
jgi:hypothetical protein